MRTLRQPLQMPYEEGVVDSELSLKDYANLDDIMRNFLTSKKALL